MTFGSLVDEVKVRLRNSRLITAHAHYAKAPRLDVAERTERMRAIVTSENERRDAENVVAAQLYGKGRQ